MGVTAGAAQPAVRCIYGCGGCSVLAAVGTCFACSCWCWLWVRACCLVGAMQDSLLITVHGRMCHPVDTIRSVLQLQCGAPWHLACGCMCSKHGGTTLVAGWLLLLLTRRCQEAGKLQQLSQQQGVC